MSAVMETRESLGDRLAIACRMLYMEGLMDHGGLVGVRLPSGNLLLNPREMRGTPGRHPGLMVSADMVEVDPSGRKVAPGGNNPPSETPIFTGVFAARPDVMAVFHLHLNYATLFSSVGKPLVPIGVTGAAFGASVPVHPDPTLIQRPEQGTALARTLGDGLGVILRGHGVVVAAASIEEAFAASVMLEDNALRLYRAMQIGEPQVLEGDELADAKAQIWHPKVVAKMWHFYRLKAEAEGKI